MNEGSMGDNSTDPLTLLKDLSSLLNTSGGIGGVDEMKRVTLLMKDAAHLVSRCVYLNILRMTEIPDLLEKFITEGGWDTINKWLIEAKNSENMAFILEVLKLLQRLPLKINHLKQNNTPKLVKSFAKSAGCPKVKSVASALMSSWLGIIRDATGPSDSARKKQKTKSKSDSKAEISSKKDSVKAPTISKSPALSSFRKTGLETAQESKKSSKSKSSGSKRNSLDNETASVPTKKPKAEPPKPQKKIAISAGFMDALNSIPSLPTRPVKRKPVAKPKATTGFHVQEKSPTHNSYVTGEAGDFTSSPNDRKSPSPIPSPAEPAKPKLNKYGKPKKTVRWLPDERLEAIRYFEKEKGERVLTGYYTYLSFISNRDEKNRKLRAVNVTTQSFKDALRKERSLERQKMGDFHHQGEGNWKKPKLIDLPAPLIEIGSNSVEKDIQQEREKSVLQEIFLSLEMVPESPAEPDPEPYELVPPKIIPIEDPNDPGPISSRSPTPEAEPPIKLDDNPDILKDKLREIIQTATAQTNTSNGSTNEELSPNAMKEMPFPPINNADPNMMYPDRPPVMSGPPHAYYNDPNMPPIGPPPSNAPPHRPDMLGGPPPDMMGGPPPPIPPNDHYHNHPPPNWGPPDMRHYHPPPPNFHPGYRDDNAWRPREPWRGHGHHIPGPWDEGRGMFRR